MRPGDQDPFFQYPQSQTTCSAGEVPLPIRFFDASALLALFPVARDAAMDLLRGSGTQPLPTLGGKALAGVTLVDYRDSDIGAYREAGLLIAALPQDVVPSPVALLDLLRGTDSRQAGFHVVDLPVTTELSAASGRELWGYPKFVTPIDFSLRGHQFDGRVQAPDETGDILSLSGRTGLALPLPALPQVLYSCHEGRLLRTLFNVRAKLMLSRGSRLRLHVGSGTHPMVQHLQQLGLNGAQALAAMHTDKLQARLNAGAPIATLDATDEADMATPPPPPRTAASQRNTGAPRT